MMNPVLLLRIAAVISLLFAAGHTLGGLRSSWSPIGETDVLAAMRSFRFGVQGVSRTYLEFYRGFGFILSVYLVAQAILLWQTAGLAAAHGVQARPFVVTLFLVSLASGLLTWRYLFPLPAYFGAVLTVNLGLAAMALLK